MSQVIFLNGSSSSGKTTLALALQQLLPEPYQYVALDQFRDGLPQRVRGLNAPPGSEGASGLNVKPVPAGDTTLTRIEFGEFGERVLAGMRRCIAALNEQGVPVIVDDLLLESAYLEDYASVLCSAQTWMVGVHCAPEQLAQREASRLGRFPGTALEHSARVHDHGCRYDVEVDTGVMSVEEAAAAIVAALQTPPCGLRDWLATRS